MRRLIEQPPLPEVLHTEAIRLLSAREPYRPPAGSKQRARVAMIGRRAAPPTSWVRMAIVLPIGLASAVGFAATAGRHWLLRGREAAASLVAAGGEHAEVAVRGRAAPTFARERPTPPVAEDPAATTPDVLVAGAGVTRPRGTSNGAPGISAGHTASARGSTTAPPKMASAAAASEENARLLVDAISAMRASHDPQRAWALAGDYLRRCPDGPLVEEALALSIEASTALGDPRARALAARYLGSYPGGRFHEAAERALSRFAP